MNILEPEFVDSDERRSLTQLFTKDIKQVNFYEAKKGAVLGNHYHKETEEIFLITRGSVLYNSDKMLFKGDCFIVYPMENHILKCMTDVDLVSFLTRPYSKESPDIWKK